ncbi:hypothetical protein F0562_020758 [Nyssa sinensis]|uniref:Uncharacterized protein n=1 Tax=Nyssa sinensis TaxID=561372 RepID=A0A5J5BWU3_9ASTE|nr:hypothetical protein F0562_020758 [Nyssa sinensis]
MDLGCLDLGCIEKQSNEAFLDPENNGNESVVSAARVGKNKALKEAGQSNVSSLNKFTSQIKKPPHRKGSPLNWFPRKKVDSYLKRKIKLLQEIGGMNSTLDETLGDSNPHYSRVLREKIAVRRAAHKAMEARKAAMVEASWCRILRAARIQSKEAEALLLEAEKGASEAFEAARAIGVIMYDIPECSRKHYEIETSSANGIGSATHTVTASFETAFEVDKQVAAAVKTAFIRLANCTSINKDEFKELLRKISQNPDTGLDVCKKMNLLHLLLLLRTCGLNAALAEAENSKQHDLDPAADNATASALNVAQRTSSFGAGTTTNSNVENFMDGQMRRKQVEAELPSLDKFLVKHLTKLEREVQEAKNRRKIEPIEGARMSDSTSITPDASNRYDEVGKENIDLNKKGDKKLEMEQKEIMLTLPPQNTTDCSGDSLIQIKQEISDSAEALPLDDAKDESKETEHCLEKILIKPVHRLEREKMQALSLGRDYRSHRNQKKHGGNDVPDCESLDKVLVKHVSRLEKEKMQIGAMKEAVKLKRKDRDRQLENSER